MTRTVYVIDDDVQVRTALTFMLRSMDMAPWPFIDGRDFLQSLAGLEPGCILLDMRMPGIDGLAVLARLSDHQGDWPVIAMTGHGDIALAVNAMKLGALGFVEKPMEESVLGDLLDRAFGKLAAQAGLQNRAAAARACSSSS